MTTPSNSAVTRRRQVLLLLCVSVPSFMINLDANIVAVTLPAISRSFQADFTAIEWVISTYTLTFACLVLPAGAFADRYGRKLTLLIGLGIFTGASLLCGAAPSVVVLNGARALQGVGAALQLSAALAILSHEFRGVERARAFAFWGAVVGIAITLGPLAGGTITQALGWEWAFYINVPIGVGLIALVWYVVGDSADPSAETIDVPGFFLFSGGMFTLTLALISGNARGWSNLLVLIAFAIAAILLAGFFLAEALQDRPMIDLYLFGRSTFLGANIAALAFAVSLLTMLTYLPTYLQNGLGFAPQMAGLLMLPLAVPLFIVPRITAKYLSRWLSGRALLTTGLVVVAAGLSWLALSVQYFNYSALIGGLILAGIGAGILNGEVVKVGMTVVPPERAGMASGISGTVRFTGIVVGFAALGVVLAERIRVSLNHGLDALNLAAKAPGSERLELTRRVIAGDLSGAASIAPPGLRDSIHSGICKLRRGFPSHLDCRCGICCHLGMSDMGAGSSRGYSAYPPQV